MRPRGDVLERNVSQLLRRAYVPALPRPAFRDQLHDAWLAEVRRRAETGAPKTPGAQVTGRSRPLLWIGLAASALLLLGAALLWQRGQVAPGVTERRPESVAQPEAAPSIAPTGEPSAAPELAEGGDPSAPGRRPLTGDRVETREAPAAAWTEEPTSVAALGGLDGRVLGPEGEPLTAFRVALLRDGAPSEFTAARVLEVQDEGGRFLWEEVETGTYDAYVASEGLALAHLGSLELGPERPRAQLEVQLERGGTLSGHVIDPASGLGIAGAWVVSERDTPQRMLPMHIEDVQGLWLPSTTRTRADGSFRLTNLSPGSHVLRASAPGFGPSWAHAAQVERGETTTGLTLELASGGTVVGRAERADGSPWANTMVLMTLMGLSEHPQNNYVMSRTDALGEFRIVDLPQLDMLAVLPELPGATRVQPVRVRAGETVRVDFLATSAGTRLVAELRFADGTPLALSNVALFPLLPHPNRIQIDNFKATNTDENGLLIFEGLEPGPYLLYVVEEMGRWIRLIDRLEVPPVAESVQSLVMHDYRLEGRVVNALTGEPLEGVTLQVERLDEGARQGRTDFAGGSVSDAQGGFDVAPLAPGRYVVQAHPSANAEPGQPLFGFQRSAEFVLGEDHPRVELELALSEAGVVELVLEDERGQPLAEALLVLTDADGRESFIDSESVGSAGSGGRHRLPLPTGTFDVQAFLRTRRSPTVRFDIEPGVTHELRLVLGASPSDSDSDSPSDSSGQ